MVALGNSEELLFSGRHSDEQQGNHCAVCGQQSAVLNVCHQFGEIQYSGGETSRGGCVCCDLVLLM